MVWSWPTSVRSPVTAGWWCDRTALSCSISTPVSCTTAGHHGGSWKVAYADFVTAMMAFFMVMWIMGMDPSTKSMIAGYFNDPFGVVKSPPQSKTVFALPGSPQPKTVTGTGKAG